MSTTACRRDARDPGMQARRPRSCGEYDPLALAFLFFAGETPAILQSVPLVPKNFLISGSFFYSILFYLFAILVKNKLAITI
ncbi:MAG: hypothetical protein LBP59_17375 [Planctomycetaceae bacterium]|nr:hypothetical protein [Planctomycetaceae bacterium]